MPNAFQRFIAPVNGRAPEVALFPEQRRIISELDVLKRLHVETAAELAAFRPANLDRVCKGGL
jgi:hypothetical protein